VADLDSRAGADQDETKQEHYRIVPMVARRILSVWFPRLEAERLIRRAPELAEQPLAVVEDRGGALWLASLSAAAEAAGLRRGMALGDARAICPGLMTRPADPVRAAAFRAALVRWAGRFSPWVAPEGLDALVLDITGCAHLFGGEAGLAETVVAEAEALGLGLRFGIADTRGAAWAVARFAGMGTRLAPAGDAIDQEVRATRSRAQKRRWERGGAPPPPVPGRVARGLSPIVPPGGAGAHLGPLPVAALRLAPETVAALEALGLARIADLIDLPRAALARRLGPEVMLRLDQALGRVPEPVAPVAPPPVFALRLTLPEPIGRREDVLGGLDRLLGPLCDRLRAAGVGARRLRFDLMRVDGGAQRVEVGLARPADRPEAIAALIALRLDGIDAGFGIEALRLEAPDVEPRAARQHRGQLAAGAAVAAAQAAPEDLADLIGRLGARLGLEALTRLHPADSHIPEKAASVMAAGFTGPARSWPAPAVPRPVVLFPPEPVRAGDAAVPPGDFTWRGRRHRCRAAFGPERIAPEWWLDDPAWRGGPRDYWRVETEAGDRLWLFATHGTDDPADWFAQGIFA
jgi:protein ImuB